MSRRTGDARRSRVRCAIYTRKSTSEGLEQDFNSLDAQREAGEAYIASQRREGWVCLRERYDDGGYTGGNMDRPALQHLLADVQAGKVDCIVTYKVDRLSRSLLDFARITETLDKHGVALVAVTQQFNTTHSMGRLTLNILLSFAEFERQIIAERTRDKMAAARRRGKWVGGVPVLGYDLQDRRLVLNPAEADRVRAIFGRYLRLGSLILTVRELARRGWNTKSWTTRKGVPRGGRPFRKSSLHYLLNNVVYRGKLRCNGELYDGEHEPIVSEEVFQRVQDMLKANRRCDPANRTPRPAALLSGLLFCARCRRPMHHTHTRNGARRYRYYACSPVQDQGTERCPTPSIPATEVERFVREEIHTLAASACSQRNGDGRRLLEGPRQSEFVRRIVERVEYDGDDNTLAITLKRDATQCLHEMLGNVLWRTVHE